MNNLFETLILIVYNGLSKIEIKAENSHFQNHFLTTKWLKYFLGDCSVTCGIGELIRARKCQEGYGICPGEDLKVITCRGPLDCAGQSYEPTDELLLSLLDNPVNLKAANDDTWVPPCTLPDQKMIVSCLGDNCEFDCSVGHQLLGSTDMECDKNTLKWTGNLPMCAEKCSDTTDIIFILDPLETDKEANYVQQFINLFLALFDLQKLQVKYQQKFGTNFIFYLVCRFRNDRRWNTTFMGL